MGTRPFSVGALPRASVEAGVYPPNAAEARITAEVPRCSPVRHRSCVVLRARGGACHGGA